MALWYKSHFFPEITWLFKIVVRFVLILKMRVLEALYSVCCCRLDLKHFLLDLSWFWKRGAWKLFTMFYYLCCRLERCLRAELSTRAWGTSVIQPWPCWRTTSHTRQTSCALGPSQGTLAVRSLELFLCHTHLKHHAHWGHLRVRWQTALYSFSFTRDQL